MSNQSITPQRPPGGASIVQESGTVRPASAEQALEMLDLMFADVIAQAETTIAGWAERCPLDDQDAPHAKAREIAAKDRLSRMAQDYARRYGKLDVPLISLGSDYGTMRAALRPVLDRITRPQSTLTADNPTEESAGLRIQRLQLNPAECTHFKVNQTE